MAEKVDGVSTNYKLLQIYKYFSRRLDLGRGFLFWSSGIICRGVADESPRLIEIGRGYWRRLSSATPLSFENLV